MKLTRDLREEELIKNLERFIAVRWGFAGSVIIATLVATSVFHLTLPLFPIYLITLFITLYNAGFKLYYDLRIKAHRADDSALSSRTRRFAITQSALDLICLTIITHFTGGAENPFIFYFIFHTITTSMLLPRKEAYLQAGIVSLFIVSLFIFEYAELLPHHPIEGFLNVPLYKNPVYVAAVSLVFTSTLIIATFFTVSISERLRLRERELAQSRKELEEANVKLLEKDRLKDEYVKMVSHDLKSPLASIQSLLEVLLSGFAGPVDERIRELLNRIQKKVDFVHHYTKDLLDLSRIRASQHLNLKTFSIKDVVDTAVDIASARMEGKDVQLNIEISNRLPAIEADKEQITYVFLNLIANAFKYTPSGGKIWLTVSKKGDSLVAEVRDTGIGIPSEDVPHIFEEFYRASNVATTTKGTGLGLSLAKYIIERHGGTISLESELGKGTSFKFILPIGGPDARRLS